MDAERAEMLAYLKNIQSILLTITGLLAFLAGSVIF